jgi:glycosyltransferase involved in cell wall biosynthesis
MKERYKNKNIFHLGNVINSLHEVTNSQILEKKTNSKSLLFIGSKKYLEGAQCLVRAFHELKKDYPNLSLNIIGMNESDLGDQLNEGVNCYGYLDKGKNNERELYYSLLQDAKIFVNTTPQWGAFSATLEAMYFYIPVIVTPYKEFVETFGMKIGFGCYCEKNSLDLLCANIKTIFNHPSYSTLCVNAHESVKDFTWSAYIDKMLKTIKEKL